MAELEQTRYSQFDRVQLHTTERVDYLSAPPGTELSPYGDWAVVAACADNKLLLVKGTIVIRIPAADVLKLVEYDLTQVTNICGRLSNHV